MAHTGDCTRKRNENGEVTIVTRTTRPTMEVTSSAALFKRRKLASDVRDQQFVSTCFDVMDSPDDNLSASVQAATRCSSDGSSEVLTEPELRSVDLKVEAYTEGYETEISKVAKCGFRETTPSIKISADTDKLESSTAASLRRRHQEAKMPAAAEIEEFFAAAEKQEQKRFADKYNYDVKKDVPLEGRYQWVRL